MSFKKLEIIVTAGRKGLPAACSLKGTEGRPNFNLTLSLAFVTQAKISTGQKFDLMIGEDDERGVIRLVKSDAGLVEARIGAKGGAAFFFGHIEDFGAAAQPKEFCAAELIDSNTIEVTLPPWAMN